MPLPLLHGEYVATVRFQPTPNDAWHYYRYQLRTDPGVRWDFVRGAYAAPLAVERGALEGGASWGAFLIAQAAAALVAMLALPLFYLRRWWQTPRRPSIPRVHEHELEIGPAGYATHCADSHMSLPWNQVQGIGADASGLYFINAGREAVVVPSGAFDNGEERDRFLTAARALWLKAR